MTLYLLIAAADCLVGALALTKRENKAALALALVCFSAGIWSIELFLLSFLTDPAALDLWFHLTRLGVFLIPPALALLVSQLVRVPSKMFGRGVVVPGFVFAILQYALNNTLYPSVLRPAIGGNLPLVDVIYLTFVLNFLYCFCSSILFAAVVFKRAANRDKQRIRWLLITVVVTFISAAISIYLVAYDFYLSRFVSATTNIGFMLLLFYATVQHHLMDIRLAASMAFSRVMVLLVFAGVFMVLRPILPDAPSDVGAILMFGALAVAALELYPSILRWLEANTKRLLIAGDYNVAEVIAAASPKFTRCTSQKDLTELLDELFYGTMGVKGYQVYRLEVDAGAASGQAMPLAAGQRPFALSLSDIVPAHSATQSPVVMTDEANADLKKSLQARQAACAMLVRKGSQMQALVLVGASSIGGYYRYNDIRLMEWLSGELGEALLRICTYENLDRELAEAKKRLSMLGMMNLYHHDIKAPLSIIDGIVSNDLYDNDKRRSIILEQVAWGTKLIATMAQLLKSDRKRHTGPVVLQDVVDDCCLLFKRSMQGFTVEHSGAYRVQADADDLKILFINVIKNAVEAAQPQQELQVRVKTWATEEAVFAAVADNGVGMTEQQLDCLWLNSPSTKPDGNGIGLQAIKQIADEHNAIVKVTSAPNKGTTFTFEFPRRDRDLSVLAEPQNSLA